MTRLASHHPLTIALSALAATGLIASIFTALPSLVWTSGSARAAGPPIRVAIPQIVQRPYEYYAAITDRPLFNPGRQKDPSPPSAAALAQLPPLDTYRLVGIVISKEIKLALVERKAAQQIVTLHQGDMLDGRRVDDIRNTGLELSGASGAEILSMPRAKTGAWSIAPDQH